MSSDTFLIHWRIVSSDTFLIHWRLLRHFVYDNVGFVFARGTSVSVHVSIPYPKYIGNTDLNTDLIQYSNTSSEDDTDTFHNTHKIRICDGSKYTVGIHNFDTNHNT